MRLWPQRQPPPDPAEIARTAATEAVAAYRAEQETAREQMAAKLTEFRAEVERAQGVGMLGVAPAGVGGTRKVFARDNPWQYAINHGPGYRPGQLVDIPTLRRFAQVYDVLRAMINHLKNEVEAVPFAIVSRDEDDDSAATRKRIRDVEAWMDIDGGLGGPGSTRSEFEKLIIEDLHVIGPAAIYLEPTRGGGIFQALPIDAATIRPVVDAYGFPDPGREYEQWVMGIPHRSFARKEMYWRGLYPRNDSPYPDSPCEYLCLTVLAAMSADTWNRAWLTSGTEPGRMVGLAPDLTPEQATFYIDLFEAKMSGNIEQRQKLFFYPAGAGMTQNPTRRDQDFEAFTQNLAKRCSAILGVHLSAIGLGDGKEYATQQEGSIDQTSGVGTAKLLLYLQTFYDYLFRRLGYPELQARYVTAKEESAADKADRVMKLTGVPVWTPNRGLQELGDDASTEPGADVLWVPTTYQPVDLALNPPEPAMPGTAPGTAPGTESRGDSWARITRVEEAEGGHFVTIGGHPVFITDQGGEAGGTSGGTAAPASTRHGMHAASAEERKSLAVPPAWTDVHIADDPGSALQAIGKDAKGRTQYRYSAAHADKQTVAKFERGRSFAGMLPGLRERIAKDAAGGGKNAEEAAALHLIAETGFRVGGSADTKAEKEAFGASTLLGEHVRVEGETVHFDFTGKKGVRIQKSITNPGLAKQISGRIKEGERLFDTSDAKVRDYLHSIDGQFKVKDFRTWHGTAVALKAIQEAKPPASPTAYKRARLEVGKAVAAHLGNTPAVALAAYVDPHVFEPWRHRAGVTGDG